MNNNYKTAKGIESLGKGFKCGDGGLMFRAESVNWFCGMLDWWVFEKGKVGKRKFHYNFGIQFQNCKTGLLR
jgi:hypothetical protein